MEKKFNPFVVITSGGHEKKWNREEAIARYSALVLKCTGREKEKKANVLAQLCLGENKCAD